MAQHFKEADFIPHDHKINITQGRLTWSAPSNIALIKYWGKYGMQMPANPSISFTLNSCKTITSFDFSTRPPNEKISFELFFDGTPKPEFNGKIEKFLQNALPYIPYIKQLNLRIDTSNTFPHSSGIASSASGMAALAMNLMSIERLINPEITNEYFYQKASFLARIGSGSACRSIDGKVVVWGEHAQIENSNNLFGVEFPHHLHPVFKNYQDTILLVDEGEKVVSSTLGHGLMNTNPFSEQRFKQAHENLSKLKNVLTTGNLPEFVTIVESEALTLHAMMMTSQPYFILMKPATLEVINKIWKYRNESGIQACFTLDAGANVHLLYPEKDKANVLEFIRTELVGYCQNNHYICDSVGTGAQAITDI